MTTAIYARVSTDTQDPYRQIDDCKEFIEADKFEVYADVGSGASTDREQFQDLRDDIMEGEIDKVVASELSRISRSTATFAEFLEICLENQTSLEVVDRSFPPIEGSNPMNKTIAQLMSVIAEMERSMTIERVKSGMNRARKQGKWTGRPPKGFTTNDEGYLVVNPEEYTRVCTAIEAIEDGASYAETARHTGISDSILHRIMDDSEKRKLYTAQDAEDDRIQDALEDVDESADADLDDLRERIAGLEEEIKGEQ